MNDALANVGRTGAEEMSNRYGEIGFQWKHEYEADIAGLRYVFFLPFNFPTYRLTRVLALAGFDPHAALNHFSSSVTDLHEIQPLDKDDGNSLTGRMFKLWTRATHPSAEQRTTALRVELKRWEKEAAQPK